MSHCFCMFSSAQFHLQLHFLASLLVYLPSISPPLSSLFTFPLCLSEFRGVSRMYQQLWLVSLLCWWRPKKTIGEIVGIQLSIQNECFVCLYVSVWYDGEITFCFFVFSRLTLSIRYAHCWYTSTSTFLSWNITQFQPFYTTNHVSSLKIGISSLPGRLDRVSFTIFGPQRALII